MSDQTRAFPEQPNLRFLKLEAKRRLAAGLQGAIFALVRAAAERGLAEGTRKLTGIWPGDEGQQPGNSA